MKSCFGSTFLPASLEGRNITYWWGTIHGQAVQSKDEGLIFLFVCERVSPRRPGWPETQSSAYLCLWSTGISVTKAREGLILKYVSGLDQHKSVWECGYIPREDGYSGSSSRVDYPSRPNYSRPWSQSTRLGSS